MQLVKRCVGAKAWQDLAMDGGFKLGCQKCDATWSMPEPGNVTVFAADMPEPPPLLFSKIVGCASCGNFYPSRRVLAPYSLAYQIAFAVGLASGAVAGAATGSAGILIGAGIAGFIGGRLALKSTLDVLYRSRYLKKHPNVESTSCGCGSPKPMEIVATSRLRCATCNARSVRVLS